MVKSVQRSAEKFSEPFPLSLLPLYPSASCSPLNEVFMFCCHRPWPRGVKGSFRVHSCMGGLSTFCFHSSFAWKPFLQEFQGVTDFWGGRPIAHNECWLADEEDNKE